jgi:hypothetical protein
MNSLGVAQGQVPAAAPVVLQDLLGPKMAQPTGDPEPFGRLSALGLPDEPAS